MEKYKIVFYGELQEGHDLLSVKTRMASLFKVPGVVVDKLFQGKPVLVRTDLSQEDAQAFKNLFEKAGTCCQMLEVSAKPTPPTDKKTAGTPASQAPGFSQADDTARIPASPPKAADRGFTNRQAAAPPGKSKAVLGFGLFLVVVAAIGIYRTAHEKTGPGPASPEKTAVSSKSTQPSRGSRRPSQTSPSSPGSQSQSQPLLLSTTTKAFQDPLNYYSVQLPEGFYMENKSSGKRSKLIFSYSPQISVIIIAYPMVKEWNPQASMMEKVTAFQEGKAPGLSGFQVISYGLVDISSAEGYEMILEKGDTLMRGFALVSLNKIAFSISITTMGVNHQENNDILNSAIRDSLICQ